MCSSGIGSDRQPNLRETVDDPLDILLSLEGLPSVVFAKGIFWIDLFEFFPDATGLIAITEMTKS